MIFISILDGSYLLLSTMRILFSVRFLFVIRIFVTLVSVLAVVALLSGGLILSFVSCGGGGGI